MCKYCKTKFDENISIYKCGAEIGHTSWRIIKIDDRHYSLSDDNGMVEKINFCPMCGRKLNEDALSDKEIAKLAKKCNPNYDEPTHSLEYVRWEDGFVAGYKKALSNQNSETNDTND